MTASQKVVAPFPSVVVPAEGASATARALRERLGPGPFSVVFVFAAPGLDRPDFAAALRAGFGATPVVGCTTAGEIGPHGFGTGSVVAIGLPADHTCAAVAALPDVRGLGIGCHRDTVHELLARLDRGQPPPDRRRRFAVLLVDGLSFAEEVLASSLHGALDGIPLVGGSAGDGGRFGATHVFAEGAAHPHGAALVIVQTELPFAIFKTQHFVPGERRLVVTAADSPRRIVHELDGEPAADCLSRMLEVPREHLGPETFAKHPVVVRIGGDDYVRSIQKVDADGSLTFYCAIEEGIVLRDARGVGFVDNLAQTLRRLRTEVGEPLATLTFDCILRRTECERDGHAAAVSELLRGARCAGFSTYGEQFHGMHVNQTLTGVVIGAPGGGHG